MIPKHTTLCSDTLNCNDVLAQTESFHVFARRTVQAKNANENVEGNKSKEEN